MLSNKELEELEQKYLDKYYHFLMYSLDEILEGLRSKDKIKDFWLDIWNKESKDSKKQSFSVGAERVIYYYLSNSKGLGEPNSTPVSSDLMFETKDAFIHIDLKTVQTSNIGDFTETIFIGNNQNSYNSEVIVNSVPLKYNANLPEYYEYNKTKKPCLTYFITILHDDETLKTLIINIISMPNGQLESVYKTDVLSAGKTKNQEDRDKGLLSTVRFKFSKVEYFRLLNDKKRIKIIYFDDDLKKSEHSKKLRFFLSLLSKQ